MDAPLERVGAGADEREHFSGAQVEDRHLESQTL
jgi:hypothetical protein